MSTPVFSSAGMPLWHPRTVAVHLLPEALGQIEAAAALPRMGATSVHAASAQTRGIATLRRFEAAGWIRAVHLCSPSASASSEPVQGRVLAPMAASIRNSGTRDHLSGVSIVELHEDAHAEELIGALAGDPRVESASRVPLRWLVAARRSAPVPRKIAARKSRRAVTVAAAVPPSTLLWNLQKIHWAQARARAGFLEADRISVAVLDTGVQTDHPDLLSRIQKSDYVYRYDGVTEPVEAKDYVGHGTHVAGTIGAAIGNSAGVDGICQCRLQAWKIFSDQVLYLSGSDSFAYVVHPVMYRRALADCLDKGVDVVNLSIGGGGPPDATEARLFQELVDAGTVVVAAMGNERRLGSPTSWPAAIPGVIAVGATSIDDRVTTFSNRGPHITVCAPGSAIWSTLPSYPGQTGFAARHLPGREPVTGQPMVRETDYDAWDGTSMAAPHVSAAVALLRAKHGALSSADVRDRLRAAADKVDGMNGQDFHQDYGYGRLNLENLLS